MVIIHKYVKEFKFSSSTKILIEHFNMKNNEFIRLFFFAKNTEKRVTFEYSLTPIFEPVPH